MVGRATHKVFAAVGLKTQVIASVCAGIVTVVSGNFAPSFYLRAGIDAWCFQRHKYAPLLMTSPVNPFDVIKNRLQAQVDPKKKLPTSHTLDNKLHFKGTVVCKRFDDLICCHC